MMNHNALIVPGADYSPILGMVGGEFCSLSNDETMSGEQYQTVCFKTADEISAETERALLALPGVMDVGLNQ